MFKYDNFTQAQKSWMFAYLKDNYNFTKRQFNYWLYFIQGLTNPQIAEKLGVKEASVKHIVCWLYTKLGWKIDTKKNLRVRVRFFHLMDWEMFWLTFTDKNVKDVFLTKKFYVKKDDDVSLTKNKKVISLPAGVKNKQIAVNKG